MKIIKTLEPIECEKCSKVFATNILQEDEWSQLWSDAIDNVCLRLSA